MMKMKIKIKNLPMAKQRERAALLKGESRARILLRAIDKKIADGIAITHEAREIARERLENYGVWLFCFDYHNRNIGK